MELYQKNGKHVKGRRDFFAWKEEDDRLSSSSYSSSDDEYTNICLMVHQKSEDSKAYTFDPEVKPSYKQFSRAFNDFHADAL